MKHAIPLKSIQNARELGGYKTADGREVRSGLLLRTAGLHGISDEDIRTLTQTYRLQDVMDFRMDMELVGMADPAIPDAVYHHLDVIDLEMYGDAVSADIDFTKMSIEQMVEVSVQMGMIDEDLYIGFLDREKGKKAFADFFRILIAADPDRAVLWHCTSGKDRTGLAAMLLLTALGVEEEVILEDYLLTNAFNARRMEGTRQFLKAKGMDDAFIDKAILVFDGVDRRFMENALAYLKETYGSVMGYIRDALRVSQESVDSLKEKYLI